MKSKLLSAAFAVLFVALSISQAGACVGKSLVVGCVEAPKSGAISEMLGVLITERTGTTVVVKSFGDYKQLSEAQKKGEVDISIDYTGRCYVDVLGYPAEGDAVKVFSAVKDTYNREMNLVWLEPFGFSDAFGKAGQSACAPVIRKDTLSKFPALPRVISKLAGKVTNDTVSKIAAEGDSAKVKKAARKFLKDNRLI